MRKRCKGTGVSAAILPKPHKSPFEDIDDLDVQDTTPAIMRVDEGSDSEINMI